jgi:lipopolysaccharide biosynthesis glycosyltransferase
LCVSLNEKKRNDKTIITFTGIKLNLLRNILYKYGGIWLDSDTVVMNDLSSLFDIIKNQDGFFILQSDDKYNKKLCNGILGTIPGTELFHKWSQSLTNILNQKQNKISWEEIGNDILKKFTDNEPYLYKNYKFYDGGENMYPVSWKIQKQE